MVRVTSLRVRDSFGKETVVRPAAEIDRDLLGPDRPWRMFELCGDEDAKIGQPWLFVAPTTAATLEGPLLEDVAFIRDEDANLAWAVERVVENQLGEGSRRDEATDRVGQPEAAAGADTGRWRYRQEVPVPPYWIPLVPLFSGELPQHILRRGRMRQWEDMDPALAAGPKGRVLTDDEILLIEEDSVPKSGVRVSRRWQLARTTDGRLALWIGRRSRHGTGDPSSGLRYDVIERD